MAQSPAPALDREVVQSTRRRKFSAADKRRILLAADRRTLQLKFDTISPFL